MRAVPLVLLIIALMAPGHASACQADGICAFDEAWGDSECAAAESQGGADTGAYVAREPIHVAAYGHEECGRGRGAKDPEGPYHEHRARVVHVSVTSRELGHGVGLTWADREGATDGATHSSGCDVVVHTWNGSSDAPSVATPCPGPPARDGLGPRAAVTSATRK